MNDDTTYIYESPDGGKTVTRREFGSLNKEEYYMTPEHSSDYDVHTDVDYVSDWNLTLGSNVYGIIDSDTISASSILHHPDITLVDEDGKKYSLRQMSDRLETIEKRLTILVPDDKLLERYEVLQDLYAQYKAAESLLFGPEIEDEK